MERSSISQAVQIGVEAVPGTAVAATRRLGSIGVELGVQADVNAQRPTGQKYANLQVLGKEWSEASVSGNPAYPELPYLFASLMSAPTITPVLNGTVPVASLWTFDSSSFGADNPKTFTVEQGDAVRAQRAAYALLSDLTVGWSRDEVTLDGTMMARAIEDGIALTPAAAMLPQVPVRPAELSVYLDGAPADLGLTKLLRAISGDWKLASRFGPVWVVDAAQPSYVAHVEGEPEATFTLLQQADAQGMANLVSMRNGSTRFCRLEAVGPIIAGTVRHKMTLDMAGQISDVGSFSDEDGVYAAEWTFGAVHDPDWGRAMKVQITTTTAAL